jgi:hypothetical protein
MNLSCTGEKDIFESDGEGKESFSNRENSYGRD